MLDKPLPAVVKIIFSYENAFLIEGKEFERSANIDNCQLYNDDQVFVMWNWTWLDENSSNEDETSSKASGKIKDVNDESDDDSSNAIPAITHSVIFKCIGSTKEHVYQETLALANKKRSEGIALPVKLLKETSNPVDAKAIAFVVNINDTWEWIGYVVQEIRDEVHKAMDDCCILNVQLDCIKRMLYFKHPGWYAGIKITRSGEWSHNVIHSRSTLA
ncbi:uncharacterized protein [Dysidea avara]|uniref:uncharacterized protein n=1 Tax=Dysidea avara TaxID=196820 RepID=UPI003322BA99